MLAHIPTDTEVLRKWLRAGFVESRTWFATEAGTPQGGIISPTLANLTLDGLEQLLWQRFRPKSGPRVGDRRVYHNPRVNLIRYADDFVITGGSRELLEKEVRPLVERFLAERGLTLSAEKTKITHISEGFDFLGQNLRKHRRQMLVTPSKKNVHAFLERVRTILWNNRGSAQEPLIRHLSLVIRGWANYHRHIAAKRTFSKVDYRIFESLWYWARRRHPNKKSTWLARRYWQQVGTRFWEFAVDASHTRDGRPIKLRLAQASDVPIRRHIKIKSDANPYDPKWTPYFEARARPGGRDLPARGGGKVML